jgi:Flp pilus assembly protein TadD, contains TPR repeats
MSQSLIHKNARNLVGRLMIGGGVLIALVFGFFSIKWQLGNAIAELTTPAQPNAGQIAALAHSLAPADPMPLWLMAAKAKEDYSAEGARRAVEILEAVARRSPEDFRWWIELGRAYEQAEQFDKAETAFNRSIAVAPEYTYPRWQFGNFLIRQGRSEDAFAQLKEATRKSPVYREQVFSLAWDYFDKDASRVEQLAADTPEVRANLALFYAVRSSSENSLRMWNSLDEEKKAEHIATAKIIAQGLHDKRLFRQALEFAKQTGIDPEAAQENISNGGFEGLIGKPEETLFGWRVNRTEGRVDISTDSAVKFQGDRSLKVNFRTFDKRDFNNISQIVTIVPGQLYRLSFKLRTENLKSGGTPFVQVLNTVDDSVVAATEPFPGGTADWKEYAIDFVAPENAEGIGIRTSRLYCGEQCPIIGILWYDDFKLERI